MYILVEIDAIDTKQYLNFIAKTSGLTLFCGSYMCFIVKTSGLTLFCGSCVSDFNRCCPLSHCK